ncbi:MAG: MotA/TolQ/ExbB proton channel family protein [Opitutaceae bacterium]
MKKGRTLALWGAWLQLGPVFGMIGSVIGMVRAFNEIGTDGPGDPELLAEHISLALRTTAYGMIPALIGLVLLLVALFSSEYRAPWFFWFMVIYAVLSLLAFPIGTVIGIVILAYIIPRKKEFSGEPVGVEQ